MPWITGTPRRITIGHFCDQTKAPDGGAAGTNPFGVKYKRYKPEPKKVVSTAGNNGIEHKGPAKAEQQQQVKAEQQTEPQSQSPPEQQKSQSITNHGQNDTADSTVKNVDNCKRIEPEQSGQREQPVRSNPPVQPQRYVQVNQQARSKQHNAHRAVNSAPVISTVRGPRVHERIEHEPPTDDSAVTGIPFPPCDGIADFYRPRICYYQSRLRRPGTEPSLDSRRRAPQLDHLDVVKIWRGLSSEKAEELVFWEAIFRKVLGDLLQGQFQLFYQYSQIPNSLPPCSDRAHDNDVVQSFPLNIVDIATTIIRQAKQRGFGAFYWFLSSGDIHTTVAQFILAHDCFEFARPAADGLSISAKLKQPENRSDIAAVSAPQLPVEVCWYPDYLCFDGWEYMTFEGEEFHLRPHYRSSSGFNTSAHGLTSPHVVFTTTATWLRWNPQISGFTGIVPFFSDSEEHSLHPNANVITSRGSNNNSRMYTLQVVVKAIATDYFDADVRYEQTVRARVTINVSPRPSQAKNHPPDYEIRKQQPAGSDSKWPEIFHRELDVGQEATSGSIPQMGVLSSTNNGDIGTFDNPLPKHASNEHLNVFPLRYCANRHHIRRQPDLAEADKSEWPGEQFALSQSVYSRIEEQIAADLDATKQYPTFLGQNDTLSSISKKLKGFVQDQLSSTGYVKDDKVAPDWRMKREKRKYTTKKAHSPELDGGLFCASSGQSGDTLHRSGSSSTCQGEYLASTSFGALENNANRAPVRPDSALSGNGAITPPQPPPQWRNRPIATCENPSAHREIGPSTQIPSAQIHGHPALRPAGEDFYPFLIRGEDRAQFVQMLRDRFTEEYQYTDSELEDILACSTLGSSAVSGGASPCADDDEGYEPGGDTDADEVDDFSNGVTLHGSEGPQDAFL